MKGQQKQQKNHASSETNKTTVPGLQVRLAATRLLGAVLDKHTSLDGLIDNDHGHPHYLALAANDRALLRAILLSALRHRCQISAILGRLLSRPLPQNAVSLTHLLHISLSQLLYLDVAPHAVVDLAVQAAQSDPRNRRFANLVNAVLRNCLRRKQALLDASADQINAPQWFIDMVKDQWGEAKMRDIMAICQYPAPIDLTVKQDPELWAQRLEGLHLVNDSVRLPPLKSSITQLPGFDEGEWFVQDSAASLPVHLMGDIRSKKVADFCAAPGGKTAQMILAGGHVHAYDQSGNRLRRLQQNLQRLNLEAETFVSDIRHIEGQDIYDAVLLDAPCSSTGTIRRHPDVLWTKTPQDVEKLAHLQHELLVHAIRLTKKNGIIVFSNCSLAFAEGETMIAKLIAEQGGVEIMPPPLDQFPYLQNWTTAENYIRTTPADLPSTDPLMAGMDGFFAVRLRKI